jgi:hypothetical protein
MCRRKITIFTHAKKAYMKTLLLISQLFFISVGFSQLVDDFSDGDFTTNPAWLGTTTDYFVNPSFELQTNLSVAATSYLSTPHSLTTLDNKEWRMRVKMTFSPSTSNFGRAYLLSNNVNPTINPDGFYLQFGEALSVDAVKLFKQVGGVSTLICSGASGQIANSFNFGVRVTRDATGLWSLYTDPAGGTNYTFEGSGTDAQNLVGTYFSWQCVYTSSNANKFFLDDVFVGNIVVDVAAPVLLSATPLSVSTVDALFNESLNQAIAEDPNNYDLPPFNSISTAVLDAINPKLVHLTTALPMLNGNTYSLTAYNIQDLSGNDSIAQSVVFTYIIPVAPSPGDVIINEFFPDPTPTVGLPELEFVEIYNRSNKFLNIYKWKIGDATSDGTIASSILAPGEYRVLCATSSVVSFPGSVGVTSFPSLNNAGDNVVLKDSNGVVLDFLTYTDAWYQDEVKKLGGYTLERINPLLTCSSSQNWIASNAASGGTPNAQNSVFSNAPDTNPPSLIGVVANTPNSLNLKFSEPLDSLTLANSVFSVSPALTELSRTISASQPVEMTMLFTPNFANSTVYNFTLQPIEDCAGNSANLTGQFVLTDQPLPGDVLINEFFPDPSPVVGLPELEFIEVYNRSNKYFNLNKWKIGDASADGTIGLKILGPGEYTILCASSSVADYPGSVAVSSFPSLNNASDDIVLKDSNGVVLDKISYTDDWYQNDVKKAGGYTLERINPTLPCSSTKNWIASNSSTGGTPGLQNSVYSNAPDTQAPSFESVFVEAPNVLKLVFDEPVDSLSLANAIFSVQPNLTETSRTILIAQPLEMTMTFSPNFEVSQVYNFILQNVEDCAGNLANLSSSFILPDNPVTNDVVINEILFNPLTGGSDYVELYNRSNKVLDLFGWQFANIAGDTIANKKTIAKHFILLPGEYVVVSKDTTNVKQNYPSHGIGRFVKSDLPSYNTADGNVIVLSGSTVLDRVGYSADWHFALLDSDKGKSLERINAEDPSQLSDNWHTAAESVQFGTPGRENSQFAPVVSSGEFTLTNKVFSPDNDGYEDVLQIRYKMNENDVLATITIYDDLGRVVRKLKENEYLATEGLFTWDGLNDDGQKASIGQYILFFEAFRPDGGSIFREKKVCVLAGKI